MRIAWVATGIGLVALVGSACGDSASDDGTGGAGAAGGQTTACNATNASTVCNDENPCTQDACNEGNGTCTHTPFDDVPLTEQVGDCKKLVCIDGQPVTQNNDTDVYKDGNDCTTDTCSEGTPLNTPVAAGSACSDAQNASAHVCDAAGTCVECLAPTDCTELPPDSECFTRACTAGSCGPMYADEGVPLAAQTAGDCLVDQCDGLGDVESVPDDDDVPGDDGNECTASECNAGAPEHVALAAGEPCSTGVCNGDAVGPACVECVDDGQCPGSTCDLGTNTCI
jgi:hypothetical protein